MKKVSIILLFVAIAVCMLALPSLAETIEDRAAANETALLSEYWTEGSEAVSGFNEYLLAVTDETSPILFLQRTASPFSTWTAH